MSTLRIRRVLGIGRRGGDEDAGARTLLVNDWYSHAVGHVVEALRHCLGYHICNPELRIALVLNRSMPTELVACAPFVSEAYAVPYTSFGTVVGSPGRALSRIPRDWDHVVHHPASIDPEEQRFEGLRRYFEASRRHFRPRLTVGVAGQPPPAYEPHRPLRLALPDAERERALREVGGRRTIAVMPAGSGARYLYPSTTSWLEILDELERRLPDAAFALVGRLDDAGGRTSSGFTRGEVDRLLASREGTIDAFDRPILDQLAIVERSVLFVSPHTGFGFAAVAVDTPWLTLAGGDWPEYFFNGVPFYSVLPKGGGVPAFVHSRTLPMIEFDEDGEGPRSATMGVDRVRRDLEELGDAAEALVSGRLTYEEALAGYFPRLLEAYGGDRSLIRSFEDVHVRYVADDRSP